MKTTLLNEPSDMDWLFETHLRWMAQHRKRFRSVMLYGNEDAPARLDLYADQNPTINDLPTIVALWGTEVEERYAAE